MVNKVVRQEVEEGPVLHVLGDQPELRPSPGVLVVGSDEAEDVLVAQHHRLEDLNLPGPGFFVDGGEHLDGVVLAPPLAKPDLAIAAFADDLLQGHLSSHAALGQQRKA